MHKKNTKSECPVKRRRGVALTMWWWWGVGVSRVSCPVGAWMLEKVGPYHSSSADIGRASGNQPSRHRRAMASVQGAQARGP